MISPWIFDFRVFEVQQWLMRNWQTQRQKWANCSLSPKDILTNSPVWWGERDILSTLLFAWGVTDWGRQYSRVGGGAVLRSQFIEESRASRQSGGLLHQWDQDRWVFQDRQLPPEPLIQSHEQPVSPSGVGLQNSPPPGWSPYTTNISYRAPGCLLMPPPSPHKH